jgi:hypothetical protein
LQGIVKGIKAKGHHRQPPSSSSTASHKQPQSQKRKQLQLRDTCLDEQSPSDRSRVSPKSHEQVLEPPYDPVAYWAETTFWPKEFGEKGFQRNQRNYISIHYLSIVPPTFSMHHSESCIQEMAEYGIHMDGPDLMHNDSKDFCRKLLIGTRAPRCYPVERFPEIVCHMSGSKKRIQNFIMPWVIPSAEDLFFGGKADMEYLGDEAQEDWFKCEAMGSTRPMPDCAIGILPNKAFTEGHLRKLKSFATPANPFFFTDRVCFPFLLCEVATGAQGLAAADRKNAHSASIAARAIIELVKAGSEAPHVDQLYGKVLTFSISHDDRQAKLYGHYAVASGRPDGRPEFRRHHIGTYSIKSNEMFTAYNFVRNIYETFAPIHRDRIKRAADCLPASTYAQGISIHPVTAAHQLLEQQDKKVQQLNEMIQQQGEQNKHLNGTIHQLNETIQWQGEQNKQLNETIRQLMETMNAQARK